MTSFLSLHAAAAARGDGLRPELLALLARVAAAPQAALTPRPDSMIQSGPDPASTTGAEHHVVLPLRADTAQAEAGSRRRR